MTKQVPLGQIAARCNKEFALLNSLHAFCDCLQPERPGKVDYAVDEGSAVGVLDHIMNE